MRALLVSLVVALAPVQALASTCYAFVEGVPGIEYASLGGVAAVSPSVDIMFVGHSTFRIETEEGVVINTDYAGANGPGRVPDVVTMNNAHSTHWTANPDPGIDHVLRGWNPMGDGPAEHRVEVGDVTIRNVTTDIRGYGGTRKDGNSIFVFEVADLCIGHLGHLHHTPTEEQYAALGRMDILMIPVDGTYTMNIQSMIGVAKRLKSALVLPMHAFGPGSLRRFVAGMSDEFDVIESEEHVLTVSHDTLPSTPRVVVMPPVRYMNREDLDGLD